MRTTTLSLLWLFSSACVTQGTYDLLKGERDHLEDELSARNKTIEERDKKITPQEKQGGKLEATLADPPAKKQALPPRLNRSLADLANRTKDASKLKAD